MFPVIETERLRLRPFEADDVDALHARRNEPTVAEYQNWTLPYPRAEAEKLVAELIEDAGEIDGWRMLVITDRTTGTTLGDVAVGLSSQGRTAEIGFTLDADNWGRGYATEAAGAVVEHLFEVVGVSRVCGMLHPDNPASARVLERLGFVFEGHTRLSFWLGDDNSDDWIYGLTRADWDTWRNRPVIPARNVALVEITHHNSRAVEKLRTHKTQETFVAPVTASFTDALFPENVDGRPVVPWLRAIETDGELVGFVMLTEPTDHHPEPYLWRLLVDRLHQRRGIGEQALELVVQQCRDWGASRVEVSWVDGPGSPRAFYERLGFEPTGNLVDGEIEAWLPLR